MPKKPKKETITPPTKKSVKAAAKETAQGSSPGGRVLVEEEIAKRQLAKRKGPKR
jgi:hypothetical protein